MNTALILVDVQRDFLPGGRLAVEDGDAIVPVLNDLIPRYPIVVATQDWHPEGHLSFASNHPGAQPFDKIQLDGFDQTLWPDHCTWGSEGAEFAPDLDMGPVSAIFRKGMDPRVDSYSGFFDNGRRHKTGLGEWLRAMGVEAVHIGGLAAEICVSYTARDAAGEHFKAAIIQDATRALSNKDFDQTCADLERKGVTIAPARELLG